MPISCWISYSALKLDQYYFHWKGSWKKKNDNTTATDTATESTTITGSGSGTTTIIQTCYSFKVFIKLMS